MKTEVFKLNSVADGLSSFFGGLVDKFRAKKNCQVTVIVRQSDEQTKMSSTDFEGSTTHPKKVSFNHDQMPLIFGQHRQLTEFSLQDSLVSASQPYTEKHLGNSKIKNIINKMRLNFVQEEDRQTSRNSSSLKVFTKQPQKVNCFSQTQQRLLAVQRALVDQINQPERYSLRLNNLSVESEVSYSKDTSNQTDSQAGFLIQSHLNQALQLIELGDMQKLQDFLYNFKQKHSYITQRAQVKWNLLMAHCKETKKQFQRAATSYLQVIKAIQENPRLLFVQRGQIQSHLGKCYFQIGQWNKGIDSFRNAINIYRQKKKSQQYANCLANLGMIYLQTGYYTEAQKCFLTAHSVKRLQGGLKRPKTSTLPILIHLIDCSLKLRNYKQAKQVINDAEIIISEAEYIEVHIIVRIQIRKARLSFALGNYQSTYSLCNNALMLLVKQQIDCCEYAQIFELMATLKLQQGSLKKSRQYFEKALKVLTKHQSSDSQKIIILKNRIEELGECLQRQSQELQTQRIKKTSPTSIRLEHK